MPTRRFKFARTASLVFLAAIFGAAISAFAPAALHTPAVEAATQRNVAAPPDVAAGDITATRQNAIVQAIQKAAPAVVTINVVAIKRERYLDPNYNNFMELFGFSAGPGGAVRERQQTVESLGSGFIFDNNGHILTNYHVLQGGDAISSVTLADGRQLEVEYVGHDEHTDLAVLKAKGAGLPHINLGNSSNLMTGEWAIAIGNPFGNMMQDPQPSVSVGVVSANHRRVKRDVGDGERLYQDMIQTDAAINPGNSGGPLVNAQGQAVGVNTMIFSSSGGYQGLGFAIPIDRARRVAEEIIKYGRRRDPWFGFKGESVANLDAYTLQQLNVRAEKGVLVTEIRRDAPAFKAGLATGDIITQVNSQAIKDPIDIDLVNWALFIDDPVTLTYTHDGKAITAKFNVQELPEK